MKYVEVSAKSGLNVEEAFRTLVTDIKEKYDEMDEPIFNPNGIQIRSRLNSSTDRKCAC